MLPNKLAHTLWAVGDKKGRKCTSKNREWLSDFVKKNDAKHWYIISSTEGVGRSNDVHKITIGGGRVRKSVYCLVLQKTLVVNIDVRGVDVIQLHVLEVGLQLGLQIVRARL